MCIRDRLLVQSRSLDHVAELVLKKQDMLASIPAVQPINNKDLTMIASGYGMRIHPIHKIPKFHAGMDFTAKVGTPIYATCLLYTSDAADERSSVDLGGRWIIKKKKIKASYRWPDTY